MVCHYQTHLQQVVTYILQVNVHTMYMIKLVEKSALLGVTLITGQTLLTSAGYTVNNSPSQGAILQTSQGAFGHVAYVESVNSNGSITVSEMNYGHGVGVVTSRTISASQAASYNYIH